MSVQEATEQSLYHRLGGYDAVAAATDDLLGRLLGDPRINGFWKGISADKRRKARQLIVDFMTEAAGGPAYYLGADMKKAHEGMQINADDWAVFMEHATATLQSPHSSRARDGRGARVPGESSSGRGRGRLTGTHPGGHDASPRRPHRCHTAYSDRARLTLSIKDENFREIPCQPRRTRPLSVAILTRP